MAQVWVAIQLLIYHPLSSGLFAMSYDYTADYALYIECFEESVTSLWEEPLTLEEFIEGQKEMAREDWLLDE